MKTKMAPELWKNLSHFKFYEKLFIRTRVVLCHGQTGVRMERF
jgi:hypothetical protein